VYLISTTNVLLTSGK